VDALAAFGQAFQTRDAFLGEAKRNPFSAAGCPALALDDGFAAGGLASPGAQVVTLEPALRSRQRTAGQYHPPAAICPIYVLGNLHRGSTLSDHWRSKGRDLLAR